MSICVSFGIPRSPRSLSLLCRGTKITICVAFSFQNLRNLNLITPFRMWIFLSAWKELEIFVAENTPVHSVHIAL